MWSVYAAWYMMKKSTRLNTSEAQTLARHWKVRWGMQVADFRTWSERFAKYKRLKFNYIWEQRTLIKQIIFLPNYYAICFLFNYVYLRYLVVQCLVISGISLLSTVKFKHQRGVFALSKVVCGRDLNLWVAA